MSFGDILFKHLETMDMKQKELARTLNVSKQTISAYISGRSTPTYKALVKICKLFNKDANYFMQDDLGDILTTHHSSEDETLLNAYQNLSVSDKRIVDFILGIEEYGNIKTLDQQDYFDNIIKMDEIKYLPLVKQKASAGIGDRVYENADANNEDMVCFPSKQVPDKATHAIIIDGHSMEPTFFDGQIVFIQYQQDCNDGDYGIYQVLTEDKSDVYCKQLKYNEEGKKYLHSVNPKSDDPEFVEQEGVVLYCIGKILQK